MAPRRPKTTMYVYVSMCIYMRMCTCMCVYLCFTTCFSTSLLPTIRLGIGSGWAGGDTRSVNNLPLGPFVRLPLGGTKRAKGVPNRGRVRRAGFAAGPSAGLPTGPRSAGGVCRIGRGYAMRTSPLGPSAELPMRPRKRVRGVPNRVRVRHADFAAGAFGGVPSGAANRARGVPKWACGDKQTCGRKYKALITRCARR